MSYSYIWRLRFLVFVILLFSFLLLAKLFFVQVIKGDYWAKEVNKQYTQSEPSQYSRGSIYFKTIDGTLISAATLKSSFRLVINPNRINFPEDTYASLSSVIELNKEDFIERASKDDPYEVIQTRIDENTKDRIKNLKLEGVSLESENWRYYPGGRLASSVLGFVGYNSEDFGGRYGLERYYDDVLSRNSDSLYVNFFAELFANVGNLITKGSIKKEGNLILTIEPSVQKYIENVLFEIEKTYNTDSGGIIIINPKSGEVFAMSSLPNYNPGSYFEEEDISVFSNSSIESVYEFGSIVKPLTMGAALDSNSIKESDTYHDYGFVEIDGKKIENFDGVARGVVTMQEILNQSLNTGAVHLMQKIGKHKFRDYMLAYGLGSKTKIDLPDEVSGLVENFNSSREIEFATASFGQGFAVTPIQMTRSLATLANGGYLLRPYVVDTIDYKGYPDRVVKTDEQDKVLNKNTTDTITRMLVEVVDEALLGGSVKLDNYSIAAKTGTAQISNPNGGGYYKNKFLHSFFGYFPAYDAKFLVFLYIVDPKGVKYASQTLTNPFMDITKFLINHYEIPPDR